ncbi:MAG TPA: hypothetical protein VK508_21545 [Cyclobacteriaceae bacterium]|nr:hypothetical protein [Cyclobacteriaceae bacterium]
MPDEKDPLDRIKYLLESKSTAKQVTYKNLLTAFESLRKESSRIITELATRVKAYDEDVTIHFREVNEHEFEVKLAGDLLTFVLHTNVVTFDPASAVMQDPYIKQNVVNRYFGQIMIYNFMADSLKFNRINDPGYLIARLLINHEGRYVVEGDGQLAALAGKISPAPITEEELAILVKFVLTMAIENDLMAPPFPDVRFITLHQKMEKTQELGAGQKIGFRMSYQNKVPS